MFQGSFKGGSRKIEGCSERPLKVIQGCFKVFKRSSKGVSEQFQKCFKEVLRVNKGSFNCVSRKFHKKCQGCFKNLSMKCCFVIGCSMNLIAATREEGGLVLYKAVSSHLKMESG